MSKTLLCNTIHNSQTKNNFEGKKESIYYYDLPTIEIQNDFNTNDPEILQKHNLVFNRMQTNKLWPQYLSPDIPFS